MNERGNDHWLEVRAHGSLAERRERRREAARLAAAEAAGPVEEMDDRSWNQ
jgi:hypothetical protein